MNLKLLTSSQIILALALVSCGPPRPYQPDYLVNAAVVCDYDYRTPTLADDCDRVTGYYYHPGIYGLYWRPIGAPSVIVYNNYRMYGSSYIPGGTVRLNEPIATSATGQPVRDKRGNVRTGPKASDYNQTPLSSSPKPPSTYKPTIAKPASDPGSAQSGSSKKSNPSGTTNTGTSSTNKTNSKPAQSSSAIQPSSTKPSSTKPSSTKPGGTASPSSPVRSSNSSSFSKSPSSSSSSGGASSASSRPSKSSSSSFSSSKSSGG